MWDKCQDMRQILYHNLWYIDGIQLTKFGLLIDRTPSIYLKVRLKDLASVFFFVFDKCLILFPWVYRWFIENDKIKTNKPVIIWRCDFWSPRTRSIFCGTTLLKPIIEVGPRTSNVHNHDGLEHTQSKSHILRKTWHCVDRDAVCWWTLLWGM